MGKEIESLPTESLIPYARNARTHSDAQVAQIAASIREFGFNNPVLIDSDGGIIAGHGRVMAARKLGLEEVPCLRLSHLSDVQRRAYILVDNRLPELAGWNDALLGLELAALQLDEFDLGLIGFDPDELARLLDGEDSAAGTEGLTDPDEVPEALPDPVTQPGDIWLLGEHRLMCGDSTDAGAVALLMDGQKSGLLHADPPYGMGKEKDGVANDNLYRDKLDAFQMQWWNAFRAFLDDNASVYVWGWEDSLMSFYLRLRDDEHDRITKRNYIVWNKKSGQGMSQESLRRFVPVTEHALFFMLGEQGFNNNSDNYWDGWEPIRGYLEGEMKKTGWSVKDLNRITGTNMGGHWVTKSQWSLITAEHYAKLQAAAKGDAFKREHDELKREHDELKRDYDALRRDFYATRAYFDNTHDNMTDVWEFPRVTGDDRHGHATPKPVDMISRAIKSSLPSDGLCVEPFSGSGTTLIAAEQTGRRCYAMEISPQYVDVAVRRWQKFTGKQAVLEATGAPFPSE